MEVTRFAPSPTGFLHLGHAFSALFSMRAAKGGRFLLRIEDIDKGRCRPEFERAIQEDLDWLGLKWETPVRLQSEHLDDYARAVETLKSGGLVYPCFCTRAEVRKEIAALGGAPHGSEGPVYPGTCRNLSASERSDRLDAGHEFALRLDVGKAAKQTGPLRWTDRMAGEQHADLALFGDVVVARKDTPTSYHLSVTVDDAIQEITLTTRGEDLFQTTHVHRLLQELLGLPTPEYFHHPLVLDEDGQRLSNRAGAPTLRDARARGVTVDELLNDISQRVACLG